MGRTMPQKFFTATAVKLYVLIGFIILMSLASQLDILVVKHPVISRRSLSVHPSISNRPRIWVYTTTRVPPTVSRFDRPWRALPRVSMPSLQTSGNRVLYSSVRVFFGSGLGHSTATLNAEISTALLLGLTYSHRTSMYDVHSRPFNASRLSASSPGRPFQHAGAVEQFFGWGRGRLPREALQNLMCKQDRNISTFYKQCPVCLPSDLPIRAAELAGKGQPLVDIKQMKILPHDLSYGILYGVKVPGAGERTDVDITKNNTVFYMPPDRCASSPAYSDFSPLSRSYLFHQYWDTHGARYDPAAARWWTAHENNSFTNFRSWYTKGAAIPALPGRGPLHRLDERGVLIAVHARRGDFINIKHRRMLPMRVIARVIDQVISTLSSANASVFDDLPVNIRVYSEGTSVKSKTGNLSDPARLVPSNHDPASMTTDFVDVDLRVLDDAAVASMLQTTTRNVNVTMCIADHTLLSLHEMIAADVFIGSASGFSTNIVGSMFSGAVMLLGDNGSKHSRKPERNTSLVHFNDVTGQISTHHRAKIEDLWSQFVVHNEDSVKYALQHQKQTT